MKRRNFVVSAAALPALAQQTGLPPQTPGQPGPPPGLGQGPGRSGALNQEMPKIDVMIADDAASMTPRFFTPAQLAALTKLSQILVPTPEGGVGATEAHAAEFLDFLIGQSPIDRQQVYLKGLDALVKVGFATMTSDQAAKAMAPLRTPWTYEPSADPLTRFLHTAKADVRTATQNSKEFSAMNASTSRRFGGVGLYWYPLD